jgi:hypothetical protein
MTQSISRDKLQTLFGHLPCSMSLPSTPSRATPVPRVGHIQPGYRSPPLPNPLPHRSPSSNTSPPTRIGLLSSPSETSRTLIPISLGLGQGNQPHLVSLVLQSKKALQHGEQLCARAHTESNASAQAAVDILTLDAKVKWLVEAVVEQLKVRFLPPHVCLGVESRLFPACCRCCEKD